MTKLVAQGVPGNLCQRACQLYTGGPTSDNGEVKRVTVNGRDAKTLRENFAEWEVTLDAKSAGTTLTAQAEDAAGNVEARPHALKRN